VSPSFQRAWAVVVRDSSPSTGDESDVARVLRVLWTEADAQTGVRRLRTADKDDRHLDYYEATEVTWS